MPKLMVVITNNEHVGAGTEENPHRIVTRYYTPGGLFLAEADPLHEPFSREEINEAVKDINP